MKSTQEKSKGKGLEGLTKIREGLPLFIEGLIDYTKELIEDKERYEVKRVINNNLEEIKKYLFDAEEIYQVPKEGLTPLKLKYNLLKANLKWNL